MQALFRHRLTIDGSDNQLYLKFLGTNDKISRVELIEPNQPMHAVEEIAHILPNQTTLINLELTAAYNKPNNFQHAYGLLSKHRDCPLPIELDGMSKIAKNKLQIPVKNVGV